MGRILKVIILLFVASCNLFAAQQLVLENDQYQTAVNTAIIFNPYENDIIHNKCNTTAPNITLQPQHGKLENIPGTTQFRYTPNKDFKGNDSIIYSLDCRGKSDEATISIEVYEPLSSEGTDFYVTYLANQNNSDKRNSIELHVLLSSRQNTWVYLENIKTGWSDSVYVKAYSKKQYQIPLNQGYLAADYQVVSNKGVHITSQAPVSVYAINYMLSSFDGTIVLPTTALGDEYIVQSYPGQLASANAEVPFEPIYPSICAIIATEDNTRVDINPSVPLRKGIPVGQSFSFMLNRGEVYQMATDEGCNKALSGTTICSSKNVAVFAGSELTAVPSRSASSGDHIVEQLTPTTMWGKKFVAVSTQGMPVDVIQVTALEDNTEVRIGGDLKATLKSKETFEYQLLGYEEACYIETNHPVCCYQYLPSRNGQPEGGSASSGGGNCDPSMLQITPLEQCISQITFGTFDAPKTDEQLNDYRTTIIVSRAARNGMMLDGRNIQAQFKSITKCEDWMYAVCKVSNDAHTISNNAGGFVAYLGGFATAESYAYNLGYDVLPLNAYITVNGELSSKAKGGTRERYTKQDFTFDFHFSSEYTDVKWILGDGTESTEKTFTHRFAGQGVFPVTLVVGRTTPICEDRYSDTLRTTICLTGPDTITIPVTLCDGGYFEYGGEKYDQAGKYPFTFKDQYEQDSVVYLNIEVLESFFHKDSVAICDNQSYEWHKDGEKIVLTEAGLYTDSLINRLGCDSTYHLILTTLSTTDENIQTELAPGDSIKIGEKWYSESGQFTAILTNANGCDHSVNISITYAEERDACEDVNSIKIPYVSDVDSQRFLVNFNTLAKNAGFKDGEMENEINITYPTFSGNNYLKPDDYVAYVYPLDSVRGDKDITMVLPLQVKYPSWVIDQHWNDMIAVLSKGYNGGYEFSAYQWFADGKPIDGETKGYLYIPGNLTADVAYSVALTRKDDGKTYSTCPIFFEPQADREGSQEQYVSVYPTFVVKENPSINILTNTTGTFTLYNALGRLILSGDFSNNMEITLPAKTNCFFFYFECADGTKQASKIIVN